MKKTLLWFLILATLALLVWGGSRAWQREQTHTAAMAEDEAARRHVRIQLQPDEITTAAQRRMPIQVPMSGTLRAVDSVSIKAQYAGQVLNLAVREGEAVQAGQTLFSVAAEDAAARVQQAQQQARAAQADLEVAQRQAENNRALADQGFLSPTARANSDASLQAARAHHQAALATIEVARKSLGDTRATSPIDGIVAARHVQPGEAVSPGQAVLDIVDLRQFELHAEVAAADSVHVAVGQRATLTIESSNTPLPAEVTRISPATQAGSRSVAVYLRVLPPEPAAAGGSAPLQLRDGLFARGEITTGEIDAIVVPQTAIRTNQPRPYVLRLDGDQTVRHQPVQPGLRIREGGMVWQAVEGLPAGTPILTGAVGLLSDGTAVQVGTAASDSGHSADGAVVPTPSGS